MSITIFDGNNFYRRKIEIDADGQTNRNILNDFRYRQETIFVVWDAPDGNKARRAIYPGYKSGRPESSDDLFVGIEQCQGMLMHTKAIQLAIPGFEADDIIAHLVRELAPKGEKMHIVSTDRDFLQLVNEFDNVSADSALKTGVMLSDVRYHKTLVGDASDSIPGIKGFGAGAWDKADQPALKRWLDAVVAGAEPPAFEFGKAQQTWLNDPANLQLLRDFWNIIGFLPIPEEQIAANIKVGTPNYAAGDAYLKELMQ